MKLRLFTDGACSGNPGPAGIGAVGLDPHGAAVFELSEYIGQGTNNLAEYVALRRGLEAAREFDFREVDVFCDSQVVVNQIAGEWACRCPHLATERLAIIELMSTFNRVNITHIYDTHNKRADRLARTAARRGYNPRKI